MTIESRLAATAHKQVVKYWVDEAMKWRAIGLAGALISFTLAVYIAVSAR